MWTSGGRRTGDEALAALVEEARADPPNPGNREERRPDEDNAERLARFLAGEEPTVVYFGKLLYNKGVHVLLEALRQVDARAVIVGFGDYRRELEELAGPRTLFTGPLEHRHLVHLLALADATVVPSIFPEAFGMVAAEAAAAGSPPLVARHSGLAEVAAGLEEEYPPHLRRLASFETGDAAELATKLTRPPRATAGRPGGPARGRPPRDGAALVVGRRRRAAAGTVRLPSCAWVTRSACRTTSSCARRGSASTRGPTSPSRWRRSSRCSTRRRSISSTASRRCRRRRRGRRSRRTSSAS